MVVAEVVLLVWVVVVVAVLLCEQQLLMCQSVRARHLPEGQALRPHHPGQVRR